MGRARSARPAVVVDRQRRIARSRSGRGRRGSGRRHEAVMVGIADVDAFVPKGSPIDEHAADQTTTVYTGIRNFPMLPEPLSTGDTSLLEDGDKLWLVIEVVVGPTASCGRRRLSRGGAQPGAADVRRRGRVARRARPAPAKVAASAELQAQLTLQSESPGLRPSATGTVPQHRDDRDPADRAERAGHRSRDRGEERATELIEDFMIAANDVVARLLEARRVSSIRRVVQDSGALGSHRGARGDARHTPAGRRRIRGRSIEFLAARRAADPDHFPDLSLAVIKLMGPGEYVLARPGDPGGAFRSGGAGLHALDGAQPPLRRPRDPASGQSRAGGRHRRIRMTARAHRRDCT